MANAEVLKRRAVDRALSRAMFDPEYARKLFSDPASELGARAGSIQATSVFDFAYQARALFWGAPAPPRVLNHAA